MEFYQFYGISKNLKKIMVRRREKNALLRARPTRKWLTPPQRYVYLTVELTCEHVFT